ncbi:ErfK/YbiS/YcfS/YnhG family protein [Chthoniobacter flavus Ellin428]|uniref:ErfK/YbiS/YcfS/YnhG family protein n=1 Tax=Chthoniobacter flavus Ellin428 TaxID=497964 RepID=B4D9K2_9BACT|nr:L,D-transpeptidase [Chthoniobacter flavus]EDY16963.1 ErfK/YbiS/YcfS/YnhG family protein [Chthoniobacter flavus Ellin428]TCO87841.1 L,D-transpeptidase-like protein [Chthoniobacter flavus]
MASAGEYSIEVDLEEQRAYLLFHHRMVMESPICSGRTQYPTPTGTFQVLEKDALHRSSFYGKMVDAAGRTVLADADADMPVPPGMRFVNAPMPYFMRFTNGVGLHEGYLPGYPASHGCVRMPKEQAIAFYNAVEIGTPVTVFGHAPSRILTSRPLTQPRLLPFFRN